MLTIWSKPQVMKSMNCISAMGRMPMVAAPTAEPMIAASARSEEHTSELQSRLHLVCRLLLEKKKKTQLIDSSPIALQPIPTADGVLDLYRPARCSYPVCLQSVMIHSSQIVALSVIS